MVWYEWCVTNHKGLKFMILMVPCTGLDSELNNFHFTESIINQLAGYLVSQLATIISRKKKNVKFFSICGVATLTVKRDLHFIWHLAPVSLLVWYIIIRLNCHIYPHLHRQHTAITNLFMIVVLHTPWEIPIQLLYYIHTAHVVIHYNYWPPPPKRSFACTFAHWTCHSQN